MNEPSAVAAKEMPGAPDPMIGRIIDGRYRIHSLVAVGGMGRVYKAEQTSLGRTVAVKTLSVDSARQAHDPHFRERFAREAAMASRLTSPNTITIFHYGRTDDDIYYMVMEYVEGITLGRLLKREGPLSTIRAATIAGQVCLSLREAHARGIVHRDIKPGNIMLIDGDYEQVKVLDFGIAKHMVRDSEDMGEELTSSRSYVGTPEYMAPECFHGGADGRSDIYSVGVVLYISVTGRLPFKGKTATQTILMALHDPPPAIDPALGVPPALADLISACLQKDPDRRPSSVDDVLHALQLCIGGAEKAGQDGQTLAGGHVEAEPWSRADDPLHAAPLLALPSSSAAPRRFARNNVMKGLLAAAALFAVGVAAAVVVRLWRGESDAGVSTRPAAAPPAPAPTTTRPMPPPSVTPFAVTAPGEAATGAVKPAPVPATDKPDLAETDRRNRRSAVRVRSDRPARASSASAGRAKSGRELSHPKRTKPEDPVPAGYKPSPY